MAETNAISTNMISTEALIAKFQYALDNKTGYIYGKTWEKWTAAKQEAYEKAYSGDSDRQMSCQYGSKWIGHYVTDCSGLFAWAFKQLGGEMYHGSNTMWLKWCTSKGTLKNGKRTDGKELLPGTAVFTYNKKTGKRGHVGLYIGNGQVIEAQGTKAGVVKSAVTLDKWVEWGELKGVNYKGGDQPMPDPTPAPEPTPEKGYAIVTGTKLALRQGPGTDCAVITRAATGSKVKIVTPPSDWEYVEYNGKKGYMMKKYLKEG